MKFFNGPRLYRVVYPTIFFSCGIIFTYDPLSAELERAIGELAHAYNERPVTLIRVLYRVADSKIQSFADSFKLRKD